MFHKCHLQHAFIQYASDVKRGDNNKKKLVNNFNKRLFGHGYNSLSKEFANFFSLKTDCIIYKSFIYGGLFLSILDDFSWENRKTTKYY